MFVNLTNNVITLLQGSELFKNVIRGAYGKLAVVKTPGCLVLPDFKLVDSFSKAEGELAKQLVFTQNIFIISKVFKKVEDAEDDVLRLAQSVYQLISDNEFEVNMNGNNKFCRLELTDIEFVERSADASVIMLEFSTNLQP